MANAKAMALVRTAIRRGELAPAITKECMDCGTQAVEYDHRDYSKPLDVDPVCHSCNSKRGKAAGEHDHVIILPVVRVTKEQYDKLQAILEQKGITYSQWLRERIERAR